MKDVSFRDENSRQPDGLFCAAYCEANAFDFAKILNGMRSKSIVYTEYRKGVGVIHRKYGAQNGDVFFFHYGVVVMWGLSQNEESEIRESSKAYQINPAEFSDCEIYSYSVEDTLKVTSGHISLPSNDISTKLGISHGLAQSVKLGTFEKRIQLRIENTKYLADNLASRGKIPLNRKEMMKMQGSVFTDRSLVNLHSDVLDTPEFFWEHSELESLYTLIAMDLDIKSRVSVLNKRMDILKELFDMLGNELNARHSSFLELTIVILILVEIFLTLAKEFFNFG